MNSTTYSPFPWGSGRVKLFPRAYISDQTAILNKMAITNFLLGTFWEMGLGRTTALQPFWWIKNALELLISVRMSGTIPLLLPLLRNLQPFSQRLWRAISSPKAYWLNLWTMLKKSLSQNFGRMNLGGGLGGGEQLHSNILSRWKRELESSSAIVRSSRNICRSSRTIGSIWSPLGKTNKQMNTHLWSKKYKNRNFKMRSLKPLQ